MSVGQNREKIFIFFLIFISCFLVLPGKVLAENKLSDIEAINLLRSAVYKPSSNSFLGSLASVNPDIEQQAALMIMKNAVQYKSLNYAFIEIPKDLLINFLKKGYFLLSLYGTGFENIMTELEKESAKEAKKILYEWLNENQVKLASGYIDKYKFVSYMGNKQDPVFGYNIIVKPKISTGENKNVSEVFIEFYSPEFIEPEGSRGHDLMLGNYWNEEEWIAFGKERVPPFIIRVKGDVAEKYAYSYDWLDGYSFEVIFNEPVPEVKIPTFVDIVKDKINEKIEEYLSNPFFNINIFKADISDTLLSYGDDKFQVSGFSQQLDNLVGNLENQCFDNTCLIKPQIVKDDIDIQEILDDISEKIDILAKKVAELTGNKITEEDKEDEKENDDEKDKTYASLDVEPAWCVKNAVAVPLMDKVIINEVAWAGSSISSSDEWIEIKNISDKPIDITGWQILDKERQIKISFDSKYEISPDGILLLERTDDNSVPLVKADSIYTGSLGNSNESLELFDGNCILQDEVLANPDWPAGDSTSKRTMERGRDLSWHTYSGIGQSGVMGTPKMENSEPGEPMVGDKVLITEIQTAGKADDKEEFVELYNPNDKDIDLTGWYVQKKTKNAASFSTFTSSTLFSGKIIKAKGYFTIAREGTALSNSADILTTYALADDNTLALKNSGGDIVDKVGWGEANDYETEPAENPEKGKSLGRKMANEEYIDSDNNKLDFEKQEPTFRHKKQSIWPMFQHDQKHTGRSDFEVGSNLGVSWTYELASFDSDCVSVVKQPVIGENGVIYYGLGQKGCSAEPDWGKIYAINPDGTFKWEFAGLSAPPNYISIGDDDALYISSGERIYSLNSDGTKKWEFSADLISSATTIDSDGNVYFTGYTNLYCLDKEGILKWKSSGVYRGGSALNGPAISDDGTVYVSWTGFRNMQDEQRGYIIGYNKEDGIVKWQAPLKYEADSPSIGENADVYVMADDIYNNDSRIYVFDQDGTNKDSIYLGHGDLTVPVVDSNGNIIVFDNWPVSAGMSWYQPVYEPYSKIVAFGQNGALLWSSGEQAGSSIGQQILLDSQGTVIVKKTFYEKYSPSIWSSWYFRPVGTALSGIDGNTGIEKWQTDLPENIISLFTLSNNGTLYFAVKEQTETGIKVNLYSFGPNGFLLKAKEKLEVSDDFELNEELNLALNEFDFDLEPEIKEEFEIEKDIFDEEASFESKAEIVDNGQSSPENLEIKNSEESEQPEIVNIPVQQEESIENNSDSETEGNPDINLGEEIITEPEIIPPPEGIPISEADPAPEERPALENNLDVAPEPITEINSIPEIISAP